MLPYFQGSGIPELNEKAEGVYYGINAGHTRGHFIRAIMEGLAIALKRMLECEEKLGATMTEIRSLGGGSKSKAWCQIKADILDMPVKVINNSESTPCMGCAILARWQMECGIPLMKLRKNSLQLKKHITLILIIKKFMKMSTINM